MLFLAMQVRVMAACMESQIDKQEYTASAQSRARDGTGGINQPSDVCGNSVIDGRPKPSPRTTRRLTMVLD